MAQEQTSQERIAHRVANMLGSSASPSASSSSSTAAATSASVSKQSTATATASTASWSRSQPKGQKNVVRSRDDDRTTDSTFPNATASRSRQITGRTASRERGGEGGGGGGGGEGGGGDQEEAEKEEEQEEKKERGFFDGFNGWKLVGAAAVGLAIGIGYSVVDQTILHKPKPQILPYTSALLQQQMPDVLERAEHFYAHRALVKTKMGKAEFDRLAREMLKQCEYFGAIYAHIMRTHAAQGGITMDGLQTHFKMKTQAKRHWDVIVQYMRAMDVLIGRRDNLNVENDFNRLYEAFQNRFYNIHQKVLGAV